MYVPCMYFCTTYFYILSTWHFFIWLIYSMSLALNEQVELPTSQTSPPWMWQQGTKKNNVSILSWRKATTSSYITWHLYSLPWTIFFDFTLASTPTKLSELREKNVKKCANRAQCPLFKQTTFPFESLHARKCTYTHTAKVLMFVGSAKPTVDCWLSVSNDTDGMGSRGLLP